MERFLICIIVMLTLIGAGSSRQAIAVENVVNVKCQTADATPLPIAAAQVQCRDFDSGALLYQSATAGNGIATMNLDDSTYKFYAYKLGSYSFTNPQTGTVNEDPESDIVLTGTAFSPTQPTEPNTCMVWGYGYDAHGELQPNCSVRIVFSSSHGSYGNAQIIKLEKTTTADANAYWEVPCVPNNIIIPSGTSYVFEIGLWKYAGLTVPNQSTCAFEDIINPPTATPTPTRTPTPTPTSTATP
jgi:hypothetical protein